jgi:hypothetical protein
MHQHAYHHGSGTAGNCGYNAEPDDDAKWMTRHTVPYIVGNCMRYLIDKAQTDCSATTCGSTSADMSLRRWPLHSDDKSCNCYHDPQVPVDPFSGGVHHDDPTGEVIPDGTPSGERAPRKCWMGNCIGSVVPQ